MKKVRDDVHPGQLWRDRDKRMLSGNRRVRVISTTRDGDHAYVTYSPVFGENNRMMEFERVFKSRYERFQRAFDLITVPSLSEE